eukprot:scaffold5553_cov102-Cylindrotheca_fusiformis.AAC.3
MSEEYEVILQSGIQISSLCECENGISFKDGRRKEEQADQFRDRGGGSIRVFFVYSSETKISDIPKESLTHLRVDSSVSEIPCEAFKDCKALVHVQLLETLTRIGGRAFQFCTGLKCVQFVSRHASLETFSIDPNLQEGTIVFPERADLQIDAMAFSYCNSLRKVTVCSLSTTFGEGAFYGCHGLIAFELPEGLQVIEENFFCASELTTVKIPSSVITIGAYAFYRCYLTSLDLPHGLLKLGDFAFAGCLSIETLHIPPTVTSIGNSTLRGCEALISVDLPDGLQVIRGRLFRSCVSLTTVKMPSSVIRIGKSAFKECRKLTSVDLPHGLLELETDCFAECHSIETLHIPPTVSFIGRYAFCGCSELKSIRLPPTLERIEYSTLRRCKKLEYIKIPSTVVFIGSYAFADCKCLSHLTIPPSVRFIEWRAFFDCCSLSHLRIPPSVNDGISLAFGCCNNLISIELPEKLFVRNNKRDRYRTDGIWHCSSLVNVALPTLPEYRTYRCSLRAQKFASLSFKEFDLHRNLKHRFSNSPLNKLCYYQSYHSSEDAMVQLRRLMDEDPLAATIQVDEFGMTPLHILSLSQIPNLDMLLTVLKEGHSDHIIRGRDSFGSTPMDYLCLNRMPNSAQVIRKVLQARFDQLLGLDCSWKSDVLQAVDEALLAEWSSRRREIGKVYFKLANYEQREVFSVMELCLWKMKIDEIAGSINEQVVDRESCRINSGASVVIPLVVPFLDKLYMEDYFTHSL